MAVLSMTGFGRATAQTEMGAFVVEVRSVNNRFFDFTPRIPREWTAIEIPLRDLVLQKITRGKVDLWIQWTPPAETSMQVTLNEAMVAEIVRRFRAAGERIGVPIDVPWGEVLRLPGLLCVRAPEVEIQSILTAVTPVINEALEQLGAMRAQEGRSLLTALRDTMAVMRRTTAEIERLRGSVLDRQRERLHKLLEQARPEVKQALSEDRLEAEVLLFADRSDITEEIVRLQSHYEAFEKLLDSDEREPVGKRLEFITQELLRESNTIGSKARDTEISKLTVELKHETEKVREQLQNIE